MRVNLSEVVVRLDIDDDGSPAAYTINGEAHCHFAWARGTGPPYSRGIYLWLTDDARILYVGKATSNRTSHLYRRITAYKRVTPGMTQHTSIRLNGEILSFARAGGTVRLVCLAMRDAEPRRVSEIEEMFIERARPPWNRLGNQNPRSIDDAMPMTDLLGLDPEGQWPSQIAIPS